MAPTGEDAPLRCAHLDEGEHHYEVVSNEDVMVFSGCYYGSMPEPPEYGRCWAQVDARNKREAIRKACLTREFAPWVDERRGDGKVPFGGITATELPVCEHGFCWGCGDDVCEACCDEAEQYANLFALMATAATGSSDGAPT